MPPNFGRCCPTRAWFRPVLGELANLGNLGQFPTHLWPLRSRATSERVCPVLVELGQVGRDFGQTRADVFAKHPPCFGSRDVSDKIVGVDSDQTWPTSPGRGRNLPKSPNSSEFVSQFERWSTSPVKCPARSWTWTRQQISRRCPRRAKMPARPCGKSSTHSRHGIGANYRADP